jgi:sec-independent protein translocase protein TatC
MRKFFSAIWRLITAPFRWLASLLNRLFRPIKKYFSEDIENNPVTDSVARVIESPGEISIHVIALRGHLLRSALYIVAAAAFSFVFNHQILSFLAAPLEGGIDALIAIEVTEPVSTVMRVTLLSGFTIAFPLIAIEAWLFIAPALSGRNRIWGFVAIPVASLLFVLGMAFAYFVMLPAALPFLLNFMGISTIPRPSSYVRFVTGIMFWIGIAFEFPLVIYILARLGWVNHRMLISQWRLAIVAIAVIAAMVTPTVDPVNMALVMGPMIVLYFLSILLARFAAQGREKAASSAT